MRRSLLAQVLSDPSELRCLSLNQWDLLLRQAQSADLLARLSEITDQGRYGVQVPDVVMPHLWAARVVQQAQAREVAREADELRALTGRMGVPVVLLKGAAYLLSRSPAGMGRTLTDLDILVPREHLSEVESELMIHGWSTTHPDPYDQRYYRFWMHELPPMMHVRRGTFLDVHHAILPITARVQSDPALILRSAQALPSREGLWVPCPSDQVLHSLAHLLFNEDLRHGLRDLSDVDLLLRFHGTKESFWPELVERADALGLGKVLVHGLMQCLDLLKTPMPPMMVEFVLKHPSLEGVKQQFLRRCWNHALDVHHPPNRHLRTRTACAILFVRAHLLRMPFPLLLQHLWFKAAQHLIPLPRRGVPCNPPQVA